MRVLFITPYFKPYMGGVERVIENLSIGLQEYSDIEKIGILTTYSNFPSGNFLSLPPKEIENKRIIYRKNFSPKDVPGIYHSFNAGYFSKGIDKILDEFSPDIIHFCKQEWFIPNLIVYHLTKSYAKHVFFSSFHPKEIQIKHLLMVACNRYLLRKPVEIHVPSTIIKESVISTFKVNPKRVHIIPLGTASPRLLIKPKANEKIVLLSVGRFCPLKGQLDLLRAFQELPKKIRNKCILSFVGTDGGDLQKIMKFISENEINNVEIKQNISDDELNQCYQNSDVYVMSSYFEGFGLSMIEAMSYGLPIIAFNQVPLPEIASQGVVFVDKYNWVEYKRKLTTLINNIEIREKIGYAGRELFIEKYQLSIMVKKVHALYKALIN